MPDPCLARTDVHLVTPSTESTIADRSPWLRVRAGRKAGGRPKISELPRWRLKRIIEYLDTHLDDPIALADMADAVGLTRMHFAAQFRASTGLRPHQYLLQRRIRRSQEMLLGTGMPIVEIALAVGFQTQSHYTSVFKRFVGRSPHAWRTAQNSKVIPLNRDHVQGTWTAKASFRQIHGHDHGNLRGTTRSTLGGVQVIAERAPEPIIRAFPRHYKEPVRRTRSHVNDLSCVKAPNKLREQQFALSLDRSTCEPAEDAAIDNQPTDIELARVNHVTLAEQLSASIAHEIRQPLTGIVTNADICLRMLASDLPNIAGARETAHRIIRDANRATEVMTRLRTLFLRMEIKTELLDINEVVREAIALLGREFEKNRINLELELDSGVSPVVGDRVQLQQVILNLLKNASDAMSLIDDRPRQLRVRVARKAEKGIIAVSIGDSGPGIKPANLERIFDPFYSTKPDGLGIGLSICRMTIAAHKGKLWAEPCVPHGATLQFELPAVANR